MLDSMNRNPASTRRAVALGLACWAWSCCAGAGPAADTDVVAAHMDRAVEPGQDFFSYANGGWLKSNPIPAAEAAWGIGNVAREQIYVDLRKINEAAAAAPGPAGSERWKIGTFWSTAMDEAKAARLGLEPLRPELDRIARISTVPEALDAAFALQPLGIDAFVDVEVEQDEKDSAVMAVHVSQGGLGLPDRDFYVNPDPGIAHIRDEYVAHVARMLKLIGSNDSEASAAAAGIMAFETALAGVSRPLQDLRDPVRNYNRMTPAAASHDLTPSIAWGERLAGYGMHADAVIVGQPEFLAALDGLLAHTPIPVLKDYLRFHLVSSYADYLSPAFEEEHFSFYRRELSGQREMRPRWKRVLAAEDSALGMAVGHLFVGEFFPAATKKRYADLVEAIRTAYSARIDRLEWMSPATKAKAQEKLARVTMKVGYPDKWKDYSALVVGSASYCENMMNSARWRFADKAARLDKPVDRAEWDMNPQTYNAYYNGSNNEIVLPAAGFLIPGVVDADVDDAVIYGYAGASTIGHELTHGFDDEGRQFDAAGNLSDWWTARDAAEFKQRAQAMADQFSAYEPLPGMHINGEASLGENIADFGGVLLGLDAFKQTEQYRKGVPINGLTPLQRYFLGYALAWLQQEREALVRQQLLSDVHAPAKWRVNGPLSNVAEFYDAFGIRAGQPMWRPESARVHIW
jgi:putative endopeptidase